MIKLAVVFRILETLIPIRVMYVYTLQNFSKISFEKNKNKKLSYG